MALDPDTYIEGGSPGPNFPEHSQSLSLNRNSKLALGCDGVDNIRYKYYAGQAASSGMFNL